MSLYWFFVGFIALVFLAELYFVNKKRPSVFVVFRVYMALLVTITIFLKFVYAPKESILELLVVLFPFSLIILGFLLWIWSEYLTMKEMTGIHFVPFIAGLTMSVMSFALWHSQLPPTITYPLITIFVIACILIARYETSRSQNDSKLQDN